MIKYIRKNQKKALALFGILLMIAFTLPLGFGQMGKGQSDHPIGTLYGKTVNSSDAIHYRNVWNAAKNRFGTGSVIVALGCARTSDNGTMATALSDPQIGLLAGQIIERYQQSPRFFPFLMRDQPPRIQALAQAIVPGLEMYTQIENNEDAFMLLVREAQANGIGADLDTIESIMVARHEPPDADSDNSSPSATRTLLRDLLTVVNSARRAGSVVKVSQPMTDYVRATQAQQISLNLLDYNAKDFLPQVTTPTDEQLKAQFEKYKADDRLTSESGFGYKFSHRVKFDAIVIPEDEVRKLIAPVQTEDVAEYYAAHKGTRDIPTTQETFSLSTNPTRPQTLNEAFETIRKRLADQRASEMTATIREAVRAPLRADYDMYKTAIDAKRTPPVSSLGVPYNSFEYLKKLRDKVQAEHKVTLTITDVGTWMTAESLKDSKEFGSLALDSERGPARFAQFVTTNIDTFLTEDQRKMLTSDKRPELWQPLPVFEDQGAKKQVIARVTAAEAAHVPATLDEVRDLVVADTKMAKAYDLAKAAANKALEAVKSGQWLQSVANAEARSMTTTGLFDPPSMDAMFESPIPRYEVGERSMRTFKKAAFSLLTQGPRTGEAPLPASRPATTKPSATGTTTGATPAAASPATKTVASATTKPTAPASTQPVAVIPPGTTQPISSAFRDHPVGIIELPTQGKVIVAEVNELKPRWTKEDANLLAAQIADNQRLQASVRIGNEWLRPENLTARTGFQPTEQRTNRNSKPKPPTLPDGNLNPFAP